MEETTKTVNEQLLEAGMKAEETGNWCSDLHVLKNDISTAFVDAYEFKDNVTTFRSEIDGTLWYDIPFAYSEYHRKRHE
jgi:hypothetical protein